jgi:hypothetical protein
MIACLGTVFINQNEIYEELRTAEIRRMIPVSE